MNPNKEYHDLNPDHSRAAWDSILECMLSVCNWVNQAQLKQPWSFTVWCVGAYTPHTHTCTHTHTHTHTHMHTHTHTHTHNTHMHTHTHAHTHTHTHTVTPKR